MPRRKRVSRPRTDCCCKTKKNTPCRLYIRKKNGNLCWRHKVKENKPQCTSRHTVYPVCQSQAQILGEPHVARRVELKKWDQRARQRQQHLADKLTIPPEGLIEYRMMMFYLKDKIDFCDRKTYSSLSEYKNKISASNTQVFFGTIDVRKLFQQEKHYGKTQLVIKYFNESMARKADPETEKNTYLGLQVEAKIYNVCNKLIARHNTSNVVTLIGSSNKCHFERLLKSEIQNGAPAKKEKVFSLITEIGFYPTRGNFLYEKISATANSHVLFQIIYTLACFQMIGITHNDLHFGNIMLMKFKKPIPVMGFRISKDKMVLLKT